VEKWSPSENIETNSVDLNHLGVKTIMSYQIFFIMSTLIAPLSKEQLKRDVVPELNLRTGLVKNFLTLVDITVTTLRQKLWPYDMRYRNCQKVLKPSKTKIAYCVIFTEVLDEESNSTRPSETLDYLSAQPSYLQWV